MGNYSSTAVYNCPCGAETHVLMECSGDLTDQQSESVTCWRCGKILANVPAIAIWTASTAEAVLAERLGRVATGEHELPDDKDSSRYCLTYSLPPATKITNLIRQMEERLFNVGFDAMIRIHRTPGSARVLVSVHTDVLRVAIFRLSHFKPYLIGQGPEGSIH
jgi:hypothetical protein